MARHVHHNALIQRLAVGAGSAAARRENQLVKARLARQARNQRDVGGGARKEHRVRQQLIDAVVGGHQQTVSVAGGGIASEALRL